MDINLFDYYLPEELIAQRPSEKRYHSRLLAVNREKHTFEDKHFYDIVNYLHEGDVLVRNNTKVLKQAQLSARLVINYPDAFGCHVTDSLLMT